MLGRVTRRSRPASPSSEEAGPSPRAEARLAGLRYSSDTQPGIRRRGAGRGFTYRDPAGKRITDRRTLERIRAIAVPPAWTDVWICAVPEGYIQATGRDARGRKQYRYHRRWSEHRDDAKFERLVAFAAALPRIRRQVARDLERAGLPHEKVVAAVVRLLELTLIRVGNDEYARLNRSFGITTLRNRHVQLDGSSVRFRFRGKSGRQHEVDIRDRRMAGIVRRCQELPGQQLFQYVDGDGQVVEVGSNDVNDYLGKASGGPFTAKDFRTWAGTVLAYRALRSQLQPESTTVAQRNVLAAIRETAERLGNTEAVCRASYVHPAITRAYLEGEIAPARAQPEAGAVAPSGAQLLSPTDERAVARLLRAAARS